MQRSAAGWQGARSWASRATIWALRACVPAIVAAAALAWLAVDSAHDAAVDRARAADASRAVTTEAVQSAADLAVQLRVLVDAQVIGAGSTGEAVNHVVSIARDLRIVLGVVGPLDGVDGDGAEQIEAVINNLGDIEAALLETEGGLGETLQAFTTAQPLVDSAVTALAAFPDQLDATAATLDSPDDARPMWRAAIVLGAFVLLVLAAAGLAVSAPTRGTQP